VPLASPRRLVATSRDRLFVAGLVLLVAFAAFLRAKGLSSGTLFRDDAWVVLTARVPLGTAWRMVGTAPLFTLALRALWGFTHTTWILQLPAYLASLLGLVLVGVTSRLFGLGRVVSLAAVALVASSRIDVAYATHLKPYAHDIIASSLVLLAAWWWRKGGSAWWLTLSAAVAMVTSFSITPLVLGVGLVVLATTPPSRRRRLIVASVPPGLLVVGVALAIYQGVSPRLDESWRASYVSWHGVHAVVSSLGAITQSLIWGLIDTTPGVHVPGLGSLLEVGFVVLLLAGLCTRGLARLPAGALVMAYIFAALHLAPLGTGRTDTYLHPALVLTAGFGAVTLSRLLRRVWRGVGVGVGVVSTAGLCLVALVGLVDRAMHPITYPGGSWSIAAAHTPLTSFPDIGRGVTVVEGTARWPWALYTAPTVRLTFSNLYNNGFAPLSTKPDVLVMPGSSIEGGYDPRSTAREAVHEAGCLHPVTVIYATDWLQRDPLAPALRQLGWRISVASSYPGYAVDVFAATHCN
jgi:hypothetical protein